MSEQLPTGTPVLVRKLRRKRHWHSSASTPDEQLTEIVREVFLYDVRPFSLFQVGSEAELDRVALALNAGRASRSEECNFVYFKTDEVQAAGIPLFQTPGDTPCKLVNHLHFDSQATEGQLRTLLGLARTAGRGVSRRTEGNMKKFIVQATAEQCLAAVPDSTECKAAGCPTAATGS